MHVHPPGWRKKLRDKFTGEISKCTPRQKVYPRGRAKVQFFEEIAGDLGGGGEAIYAVLACVLRATTEKNFQLFGEEKCTPRQNPGYAYD